MTRTPRASFEMPDPLPLPPKKKAATKVERIQKILGVKVDGIWGPKTQAALDELIAGPPGKILKGDGTWPFTAKVVGKDIVCEKISITCFGGNGDGTNSDPQDNGDTASGQNTNRNPIQGVSIPMDGRQFPNMSKAEHRALDGSPFPKIPFGTKVRVEINGTKLTAPIIDLGPGKQASSPGDPHALDLTVHAAKVFAPDIPLKKLSTRFSKRGSFRIIGGAKFVT